MRHTCPYWQICSWVTLTPIISQVVAISKTKDKMVVIISEVAEVLTIEGGFRIRLSDNEMRAARSLQEAF